MQFLSTKRVSNLNTSDDRWDALIIELQRLRWRPKAGETQKSLRDVYVGDMVRETHHKGLRDFCVGKKSSK